jgi:MFS family permease
MIVFLLSALDQTVVSTAMPRIIAELNGLTLYAWVTTAYLLTSTVMVPIWGKLGDIYGRKPVLLAGIGIFLAGSWLSGLSGEFGPVLGMSGMVQLIVFRALQGIGGGALFTTAFAIIADLYPPRERGKFAGIFGSVFGLASVLGPLIGGYFTDHGTVHLGGHVIAGWRWVFYVNLPLAAVAVHDPGEDAAAGAPADRGGRLYRRDPADRRLRAAAAGAQPGRPQLRLELAPEPGPVRLRRRGAGPVPLRPDQGQQPAGAAAAVRNRVFATSPTWPAS